MSLIICKGILFCLLIVSKKYFVYRLPQVVFVHLNWRISFTIINSYQTSNLLKCTNNTKKAMLKDYLMNYSALKKAIHSNIKTVYFFGFISNQLVHTCNKNYEFLLHFCLWVYIFLKQPTLIGNANCFELHFNYFKPTAHFSFSFWVMLYAFFEIFAL